MLSALAVSLLTKRALLIRDDELAAHFSSPFIAWHSETVSSEALLYDAIKDCDADELWKALSSHDLEETFPPNFEHVALSTNILWAPQLFSNPRYRAEVQSWGLAGHDTFFSCAMAYLLRPTLRLRQALEPLQRQILGKYSIGLQLRLNPETAQVRLDDLASFVECGKHLARARSVEPKDIRWVIATDTPDALIRLSHILGIEYEDRDSSASSDSSSPLVWWAAEQDDGTGRRAEFVHASLNATDVLRWGTKKSVDHYMLSLCNDTIISFASTFGLTGVAMAAAVPAMPGMIGSVVQFSWCYMTCFS
jgi:hypothetical protein